MLREDVVEAIREGEFHIYAVTTISEGLEVLTGSPAGEPLADGTYPEGTVTSRVAKRLLELTQSMRGYYADVLAGGIHTDRFDQRQGRLSLAGNGSQDSGMGTGAAGAGIAHGVLFGGEPQVRSDQ